jgi:hypothetical protein
MPLYLFVWGALAWTIAIAVLWPLTWPLGLYAYKLWHGPRPIEDEMQEELSRRAFWGSLFVMLTAWGFLVLDYMLATWAELPAGLVHLVVFLGLVSALAWLLMLYFALEDFFQALSLLIVYVYLPVFVLWLPNWVFFARFGTDNPLLNWFYGWLAKPQ